MGDPRPNPTAGTVNRLHPQGRPAEAVFFDLDGTLADTATDLSVPINDMRADRGLPPLPLADLRPFASMGARGLIGKGFGISREDERFAAMRDEFLARYEAAICVHTRLFEGMDEVLAVLESRRIKWGIVSNKVEHLVRPIVASLKLTERSIAIVGGDTAGVPKPDPAPLWYATRKANVDPKACIYVGDDERDVVAGQAAGMLTVAAAYGYCGEHDPPHSWGASAVIQSPRELIALLSL